MAIDSLESLLVHELSDLLSAENQFAKALQKVAKNAESDTVKQMALEHHEQTLGHIDNLKQAFTALGTKPERGVVCKAAKGLVEEAESTLKEEKPTGSLKDLALIGGSLRIEHYEIAGYTGAIGVAKTLGQREVVQLLQANLKQEKETAKKLQDGSQDILKASTPAPDGAASASAKKSPAKSKSSAKK